ncbi:S8 family serine peptidase [Sphingobium sp. YR768]|uniref:S8 family serine peptidase n=1 Tax=Sphingobium sp. YR768 TaxID=1884365 RepID=UPI0008D1D17F|nr:Subtilase family protein [Sphingobium sp. YR768]
MMRLRPILLLLLITAAPAVAQIGLPDVGGAVTSVLDRTKGSLDLFAPINEGLAPVRSVADMARDRIGRVQKFLNANRAAAEMDDQGQPARRGVILMMGGDAAAIDKIRAMGFTARSVEAFDHLDLSATELVVPEGVALSSAISALRKAVPDGDFTADHLYFPSGGAATSAAKGESAKRGSVDTPVGIIDGGVSAAVPISAVRGFAAGAPNASFHGTAVASLLRHAGVGSIVSADVFGRDPAGGSALAIVRALDWMQGQRIPVVSISLTGPGNPLLARAVAACMGRGMVIVAAVGNDGPAAPIAYPASYPAVLAVTGVDGRNRALIEAGRATHLDYAAPGADMKAMDADGHWRMVRGTSFAVPLVAARAAFMRDAGKAGAALPAALDREARDLRPKGPDRQFGRGLLCGDCRPR